MIAARELEAAHPDLSVTVADARFLKPLDTELLTQLALESDVLVTVEEGSIGGFGSHVMDFLSDRGFLDNGTLRARSMVIPDIFIEQGPMKDQYDIAQLNTPHIKAKVEQIVSSLRNYQ